MIHLRVRSEYSFQRAIGRLDQLVPLAGGFAMALTDTGGVWGHNQWLKVCAKAGIKPLLGVELLVVADAREKVRQSGTYMGFLAQSAAGLVELHRLVTLANSPACYYYCPRLDYADVNSCADGVVVLSGVAADLTRLARREHVYLEMNPVSRVWNACVAAMRGWPVVVTADNYYPRPWDQALYETIIWQPHWRQVRVTPMHLMDEAELRLAIPMAPRAAFEMTEQVAAQCQVELPPAVMLRARATVSLRARCLQGAKVLHLNVAQEPYRQRLIRELDLIHEKDFEDYFHIIADMVAEARHTMIVGPGRGSAAGSLVCYLLRITDIDPIQHGLMFERFVDITRKDLPDIDLDFPDITRDDVIAALVARYGAERVGRLGTVNRYAPKSALDDVARQIRVPLYELTDLKKAIVERSTGDARAQFCVKDTMELAIGQRMLAKYPGLQLAADLEGAARHRGMHAAGVVITEQPLVQYGAVDVSGCIQMDKYDAEQRGLLKIDVLGLRTLTVLQQCLQLIGRDYEWLRTYPLVDSEAFALFNTQQFAGIFQYEGYALQSLTKQMGVHSFDDIVAITALARPGPLHNGATTEFIKRKLGEAPPIAIHALAEPITQETFGVVVYQEQVMAIGREIGRLSWEDVSALRRAMSKSLGEEFFNRYWDAFKQGAQAQHGLNEGVALDIWKKLCTFGCLSGETVVELPCSNQYSPRRVTLAELFMTGGVAKVAVDVTNRAAQRRRKAKLWCWDGQAIRPERLAEVYQSGKQMTWLMTLDNGMKIRATKNHRFVVRRGWRTLQQLHSGMDIMVLGLAAKPKDYDYVGTGSGAHNVRHGQSKIFLARQMALRRRTRVCVNCKVAPYQETHHRDGNRLNNAMSNLMPVCRTCHKQLHWKMGHPVPVRYSRGRMPGWARIVAISDPMEEMTYDIAMPAPYHNFVAEGVVCHNSWAFNKSHAVSYGLLSYWCAVLKAHWPLEYAVACLSHPRGEDQAVKLLRELVQRGYRVVPVDPMRSGLTWQVLEDQTLLGPLTNIHGVGVAKAEQMLRRREQSQPWSAHQQRLLTNPVTPYDNLFEGQSRFGAIYANPRQHGILEPLTYIKDIQAVDGTYTFIGKLVEKNLRDLNEYGNVVKRGGQLVEGQTLFLNLFLEDDTDSIIATVSRRRYMDIGREIMEHGALGDWYLCTGEVRNNWRKVYLSEVRPLARAAEKVGPPGKETGGARVTRTGSRGGPRDGPTKHHEHGGLPASSAAVPAGGTAAVHTVRSGVVAG